MKMDRTKETYRPFEVTLIEFQVERGIAASVIGNVKQYMEVDNGPENNYTESDGLWEEY